MSFEHNLLKNGLFNVKYNMGISRILNTKGETVIEGNNISTTYSENLALVYDDDDMTDWVSGTFYDFTGEKLFSVKKMMGPLYMNNRYFTMYQKLLVKKIK